MGCREEAVGWCILMVLPHHLRGPGIRGKSLILCPAQNLTLKETRSSNSKQLRPLPGLKGNGHWPYCLAWWSQTPGMEF